MCGIYGIVGRPGGILDRPELLGAMGAAMIHRGPDDAGTFRAPELLLGMRRLSIIDLSGGHQPIANEDGTIWVVCNGEIYNFGALRERLSISGHRFRTRSDTEVIVHLYEEHGAEFVHHLSGMFGLALWDDRRKRLVLARDRFGQKPLYYAEIEGRLAFASEIKSLLELPGLRREVSSRALAEHLALGYAVGPETLLAGIRKLPPASCLTWERGEYRIREYWQLPHAVDASVSSGEWSSRVRAELERSVREHLVSDVPVGAFLSGGIDSSAIVALMAKHAHGRLRTYSIGYAGGPAEQYYNELGYAKQVASAFDTDHHEIVVRPDVVGLLPRLLWHLEEPVADSAMATTYLVSELARTSVKVILSGVGGDELFGGYRRYLGEYYLRKYRRIPRWVRRWLVAPLSEVLPSGRQSRAQDFARYAKSFVRAEAMPWEEQYRTYVAGAGREVVAQLVGSRALPGADGFDRIAASAGARDENLRLFHVDSRTQLPEDLLLLTDKMTMACSIECRAPFLDHRLAELAASIPAGIKMRNGRLKHLLKVALADVLPPEILHRSKRGFGAPMGAWLKGELMPLRRTLLSRSAVEARGLLQWPAVQQVLSSHDAGREDYADLLFGLVNLELWSRMFVDGREPADVGAELVELARAA